MATVTLQGDAHPLASASELALKNSALVRWTIKEFGFFTARDQEFQDLVQIGFVGLLRAAKLYDPTKGEFSTYAVTAIRREISRSFCNSLISIPPYLLNATYAMGRILQRYRQKGKTPHEAVICRKLKLTRKQYFCVRLAMLARSARYHLGDIQDEGQAEFEHAGASSMTITTALDRLKPRVAFVLRRRFGIDCDGSETLQEVGDAMGVTRERVRQLEAKGLQQLRFMLNGHNEKPLLPPNEAVETVPSMPKLKRKRQKRRKRKAKVTV